MLTVQLVCLLVPSATNVKLIASLLASVVVALCVPAAPPPLFVALQVTAPVSRPVAALFAALSVDVPALSVQQLIPVMVHVTPEVFTHVNCRYVPAAIALSPSPNPPLQRSFRYCETSVGFGYVPVSEPPALVVVVMLFAGFDENFANVSTFVPVPTAVIEDVSTHCVVPLAVPLMTGIAPALLISEGVS